MDDPSHRTVFYIWIICSHLYNLFDYHIFVWWNSSFLLGSSLLLVPKFDGDLFTLEWQVLFWFSWILWSCLLFLGVPLLIISTSFAVCCTPYIPSFLHAQWFQQRVWNDLLNPVFGLCSGSVFSNGPFDACGFIKVRKAMPWICLSDMKQWISQNMLFTVHYFQVLTL